MKQSKKFVVPFAGWTILALMILLGVFAEIADAQTVSPTILDPDLAVRTVVSGLNQPVSMAFLKNDDMLVLEKASGRIQRVVDGVVVGTALDLPVNSASERGLLGIALHPYFPHKPWVYLYWTESSTGADSNVVSEVPLLGNRVDRFIWDGSMLAYDINLIRLRAFQEDADQPARGNHNGGVLRFEKQSIPQKSKGRGNDRESNHALKNDDVDARSRLFIIIGDNGRRGQTQNLPEGPFVPPAPDDQFGGPEPDDMHLTGVILRLNDDGTTPVDNPFYEAGVMLGGEAGSNMQKVWAYGIRNSFGMAVDPYSGNLWEQENGDDAFDEINRVEPGMNGGWVQIMGPVARITEFKSIETTPPPGSLQQVRWPPANIADTPMEALGRLFVLPEARYSDPEFSWKYAVAPAGIGFLASKKLGSQYQGDLFVGAARTTLANGYLFRFKLTENRSAIAVEDPLLEDRVADNSAKFDVSESESLLFGTDFGIGTDIHTGPNGNLYVVSLSNGAVYEIHRGN